MNPDLVLFFIGSIWMCPCPLAIRKELCLWIDDQYCKAAKLMEEQGKVKGVNSWIVLTNMGVHVLCYETKKYKDAAKCWKLWKKTFRALEAEENYVATTEKLEEEETDFDLSAVNHETKWSVRHQLSAYSFIPFSAHPQSWKGTSAPQISLSTLYVRYNM